MGPKGSVRDLRVLPGSFRILRLSVVHKVTTHRTTDNPKQTLRALLAKSHDPPSMVFWHANVGVFGLECCVQASIQLQEFWLRLQGGFTDCLLRKLWDSVFSQVLVRRCALPLFTGIIKKSPRKSATSCCDVSRPVYCIIIQCRGIVRVMDNSRSYLSSVLANQDLGNHTQRGFMSSTLRGLQYGRGYSKP